MAAVVAGVSPGAAQAAVVAETRGTPRHIVYIDETSGAVTDLGRGRDPVVSPDGATVLYRDRGSLVIAHPSNGARRVLRKHALAPGTSHLGPVFSRNSRRAVLSIKGRGVVAVDTTRSVAVRLGLPSGSAQLSLDPSGRRVTFTSDPGVNLRVRALSKPGSGTPVTSAGLFDYPSWGPPGIAVTRYRPGRAGEHGASTLRLIDPLTRRERVLYEPPRRRRNHTILFAGRWIDDRRMWFFEQRHGSSDFWLGQVDAVTRTATLRKVRRRWFQSTSSDGRHYFVTDRSAQLVSVDFATGTRRVVAVGVANAHGS